MRPVARFFLFALAISVIFSSCKNEAGESVWFGRKNTKDDPILGCWREVPKVFPAIGSREVCFRNGNGFVYNVKATRDSSDTLALKMFRVLAFTPAVYAKGKDTIIVSWKSDDLKTMSSKMYPKDTLFNSFSGYVDNVYAYVIDGDILTLDGDRYVRKR